MAQLLTILFLTLLSYISCWGQIPDFAPLDPKRITIARDTFGIPHIFAPTDKETAYGLAWAFAEDRFEVLQDVLLLARFRQGEKKGIKGAGARLFCTIYQSQRNGD
jgi:acyl-homoserine lactone acylase PvdQ